STLPVAHNGKPNAMLFSSVRRGSLDGCMAIDDPRRVLPPSVSKTNKTAQALLHLGGPYFNR
ncbi:MAG: hypothetical protein MUO58_12355, partial [Anaerolineales bacterium]|nr:hypothetical protein [Anaerolineales bacterium]